MAGAGQEVPRRQHFYNLAQVHHSDPIRQATHGGQIVKYKDVRQPKPPFQLSKQTFF
jgi:hypothetical protein